MGGVDNKVMRETAHAIKGAVGNFGATRAVATALALENAGEQGKQAVFGELGKQLLVLLHQLKSALESELKQMRV